MSIVVRHYSSHDGHTGAGRSAYKLHDGLKKAGLKSKMIVLNKHTKDDTVLLFNNIVPPHWLIAGLIIEICNRLINKFISKEKSNFSSALFRGVGSIFLDKQNADVHLIRWTQGGFIQLQDLLKIKGRIIIVLSDESNITGGCHYSGSCNKFESKCINCPKLKFFKTLIPYISQKTKKHFVSKINNVIITTPSDWLKSKVASSYITKNIKTRTIYTGVDHELYLPLNKNKCKKELSLHPEKFTICFGAFGIKTDLRKGYNLVVGMIEILEKEKFSDNLQYIVFGDQKEDFYISKTFVNSFGYIKNDKTLNQIYSASDIFIAPSIQENFANTCLESFSSGTPVIAFKIGGMPEIIDHKKNGFLCEKITSKSLAYAVKWCFQNYKQTLKMRKHARSKILKKFTINHQTESYKKLIGEIINEN